MKQLWWILPMALLACRVGQAAEPTPVQRLEAANVAYQSGAYAQAAEQYEALLQEGYRSLALHYNLGNACYRLGKPGCAILHYERARLYGPRDADVRHNLQVVRSQLPDDIEVLSPFFLRAWWNGLSLAFSANAWSLLSIVFIWLGAGGLATWLLGHTRRLKQWGFVGGMILFMLCLFTFALSYNRNQLEINNKRAVIMQPEVALHSAPDTISTIVRQLHEGTTVELLDQINQWYKVTLANGEEGWLPANTLERI